MPYYSNFAIPKVTIVSAIMSMNKWMVKTPLLKKKKFGITSENTILK